MNNFKFYHSNRELITNTEVDKLLNTTIGDIFGFLEVVIDLEKSNQISFTKEMDRDEDLADLFRVTMAQYLNTEMLYAFTEWAAEFLTKLEAKSKEPLMVIEICPNCGKEIQMNMEQGTEKIPFCPYCGQKNIYLCSECMEELGDCQPSAHCAYCHGHPNTYKN